MNFNEFKRKHIDEEGFRLLTLIEDTNVVSNNNSGEFNRGSLGHKISEDWTDKLIDSPQIITETDFFGAISKMEIYNGRSIGLSKLNYSSVQKLAKTVSNEKSIKHRVSLEFIEGKIFQWVVKTYKAKKAESTMSYFLLDEFEDAVREYKIRFPLLYLDIAQPFKIGNATFEFLTKEFFDDFLEYKKNKKESKSNEGLDVMRKKYQGRVFVSYIVSAEKLKAEEIALAHCALAVDVLKMCSETTDFPSEKIGFDIDSRVRFSDRSEVIISNANNEFEMFNINFSSRNNLMKNWNAQWIEIILQRVKIFNDFLGSLSDEPTELELLIINSFKRYGNAISNHNHHQRVVELFTILESLLLTDNSLQIIDSVCRYSSRLVVSTLSERKELISLLKRMYDVRSKLIHHGKEVDFKEEDLRYLQQIIFSLINVLIDKAKLHTTKQSILNDIDDAILGAY